MKRERIGFVERLSVESATLGDGAFSVALVEVLLNDGTRFMSTDADWRLGELVTFTVARQIDEKALCG